MNTKSFLGAFFSLAFAFSAAFSVGMGMVMPVGDGEGVEEAHSCCPQSSSGDRENSDTPSCCLFAPAARGAATTLTSKISKASPVASSDVDAWAPRRAAARVAFIDLRPERGPDRVSPSSPRAPPRA